jgi:hypothetical protein
LTVLDYFNKDVAVIEAVYLATQGTAEAKNIGQ